MTDKLRQAAQQALDALESSQQYVDACANAKAIAGWGDQLDVAEAAITVIREALAAQPAQQEPVAWRSWNDHDGYGFWETKQEAEPWCAPDFFAEPLYTSPPASRPWVGLTPEDRYQAILPLYCDDATAVMAARHSNDEYEAIEAKLKEKNTRCSIQSKT